MFATHWENFEWLERNGFNVNPNRALCSNFDDLAEFIAKMERTATRSITRSTASSSRSIRPHCRTEFGATTKAPRWAIAYKYPGPPGDDAPLDIVVQVGRTGALTPVAYLEPDAARRHNRRPRIAPQRGRDQASRPEDRRLRSLIEKAARSSRRCSANRPFKTRRHRDRLRISRTYAPSAASTPSAPKARPSAAARIRIARQRSRRAFSVLRLAKGDGYRRPRRGPGRNARR
jgi:hypothetical protein